MRRREFKFTLGDLVQVFQGLEWASPLSSTMDRCEVVRIIEVKRERQCGVVWNSYIVQSVQDSSRVYTLMENFIRAVRPEDSKKGE